VIRTSNYGFVSVLHPWRQRPCVQKEPPRVSQRPRTVFPDFGGLLSPQTQNRPWLMNETAKAVVLARPGIYKPLAQGSTFPQ
jgi:hypothetical protein